MSDDKTDIAHMDSAPGRRLAAVLHADVVGFSRLMAVDEGGTHARLVKHREHLYDALRSHNGRVVGTAGDAVLAVFDSVVDALAAALSVQETLSKVNASLSDDERLEFRVGLNIGDIILDGEDVFGNGVNVAARTEALADPGGIAVSAAFKEQVGNRLPVTFEDRGLHSVKNIDVPLHVFAVHKGGTAPLRASPEKRRKKMVALLAAVATICAATVIVVFFERLGSNNLEPDAKTQGNATGVVATFQKPTIAVLPFDSRGPEQDDYFGDGVTEEVIGSLGRFSDLVVLSWSAVASYKAEAVEITQFAKDLGANYVVSGSIQRADTKIRINVQLTDAKNGVLIWSERYDEQITDIFELQDQLVQQVVAALSVRVTLQEETRVASKPTESLTAYDLVLKGRDILRDVARASNNEARGLFELALEEDPDYADALVAVGLTHLNDLSFGWTFRPDYSLEQAFQLARQAIELDPFNAGAFELLASAQKYSGELTEAERSIDQSLTLNGNSARSHAERCSILMFSGRPSDALQASDMALRIDPYPRGDELNCPIAANLMLEQYEAVLEIFEKHPDRISEEPASLMFRAGAHAMLGQDGEAEKYRTEALARYPFLSSHGIAQIFRDDKYQQIIVAALQAAGFD